MKNIIFVAIISVAIASCGDNNAEHAHAASDTSGSISGTSATQPADTSAVQGTGTDKIPSRTGTTGQGNTTVTGSATGSPTGTGKKDSTK